MSEHTPTRAAATRARGIAVTAMLALLAALVPATAGHAEDTDPPPSWRTADYADGWIHKQMRRMTLKEKVGQLFVTYAYGETADTTNPADVAANQRLYGVDNAEQLIDKYQLGGVIYFAWSNNVNDPHQIARLSNGVQRSALNQRVPIPLLITTDQEQGLVARVREPATQFPGNMALGAARNPEYAYTAARITGQELRAIGINQNFAPVADVNVNAQNPVIGVRSFSSDAQLAADLTAAQVRGYQRRDGVAATAKHFPGHGDTDVDSHTGIPIINHTREEWEAIDAPPFKATIADDIDAIMTAHIQMPAFDPSGDPATLSRPIMTGLLRNELGYDGVVVTDALGMQGVRDKYGDDRVPVLALKAGVDMLLMPPDFDLAYNAVLDAVRDGELTESRIDESVYRVLRLKFYRGIVRHPYVDTDKIDKVVGTDEHLAAGDAITDKTSTLVKNDDGVLPLTPGSSKAFVTGWGSQTTKRVAGQLSDRGATTDVYSTGSNPGQAAIEEAVSRAKASDVTVVTTMRAWTSGSTGQRELVKQLVATGKPVIVVAVRDPYDIAYFTEAPTYLATYSWTPVALRSLGRVLYGEVAPTGKLPVSIPTADDPDTELYPFGHGLTY